MRFLKASKKLTILSIWFFVQFISGQEANFSDVLNAFEKKDYTLIVKELQKIDTTRISDYNKATWLFYKAEYFNDTDKHAQAYKSVLASKKIFIELEQPSDVSDCNMLALSILSHQNKLKNASALMQGIINEELEKQKAGSQESKLADIYLSLGNRFIMSDNRSSAIQFYNKAKKIYSKEKNTLGIADFYENIATSYNVIEPIIVDSALYYSKLAEKQYKLLNNSYALAVNYNNQSQIYLQLKDYPKGILYLLKADSLPLKENEKKTKLIFYENLAELYELNGNPTLHAKYLKKQLELKDSINDTNQNIAISEINEKYQNEKLRANNLEIEAKRIQNRNLSYGLGGSLLLGSVIFLLIFKNRKRKQELAQQQQEVKNQKLANQLKEQELKAIDAMIEGQEKERQRIANDLHDDLGGLMATVKLHFNALKKNEKPELYDKTNALIEEAYQKVRSVAHAKNSGVIAKQGLLVAVRNMANKISAANQLQIEVVDHGLDNRLENSLELTLFRIIQELVTNVIKHAEATEVNIHLTNHEDCINIMVEDNGKGFNPQQITKTNAGMGISSIDKRVEHLQGKMTIESEKDKGTTVIIDIPLNIV